MNILLPYRNADYFSLEDESILRSLGLTREIIISEVLQDWELYVYSDSASCYEHLMDQIHERIHNTAMSVHDISAAERALAENGDKLADMVNCIAKRLEYCLKTIPADIQRIIDHEIGYQHLYVKEIREDMDAMFLGVLEVSF